MFRQMPRDSIRPTMYPVRRAFTDARVQRICAGTNEIMQVIIAKQLGLCLSRPITGDGRGRRWVFPLAIR